VATTLHVLIVGAGFGGLSLARALARDPVRVTLVDARNHHTFQPLLYQVATAGLDAESIAHSVRGIFHRQGNVTVRLGRVDGADLAGQVVSLVGGGTIPYNVLVLAAGAVTADLGVPGVAEHALGLKSLTDALDLRGHILGQFEKADAAASSAVHRAHDADATHEAGTDSAMTVVVCGGGPTGVELAGALTELFSRVLARDHPSLDLSRSRVVLVEALDRLLSSFDPRLGAHARRALEAKGVEVLTGEPVARVEPGAVHLASGRVIRTATVVWAAGVRASPLGAALGLPIDRAGRVVVDPSLRVAGRTNVFVIGDMAAVTDRRGRSAPLPQLAPVAIQEGRYVAAELRRELAGAKTRPFRYRDRGVMATIGRHDAVAQLPLGVRMTGPVAWAAWLGLHLIELIGFRNRASVLVDWAWNYVTYDRAARLIFDVLDVLDVLDVFDVEDQGVAERGE